MYNIKHRALYCQRCRVVSNDDQPEAKCKNCGQRLITIVYSLSGKPLEIKEEGEKWEI